MISRRRSYRVRGGRPRSACPAFKSAEDCNETTAGCKWNAKVSKCRKVPVKRMSKREAKKSLACYSSKTKAECNKNKCLWGNSLCTPYAPKVK